ncbi:uncharacterized protein LOC132008970 [Mustela nigripes]|uniref:uncharacterized protein LOC132008970 n=1 Tax=Mustela nigripes TaxID=77151 RepID=UPI002815AEAC|nr:uncharacterized protein LOC132008970 [Mustela nigripes]
MPEGLAAKGMRLDPGGSHTLAAVERFLDRSSSETAAPPAPLSLRVKTTHPLVTCRPRAGDAASGAPSWPEPQPPRDRPVSRRRRLLPGSASASASASASPPLGLHVGRPGSPLRPQSRRAPQPPPPPAETKADPEPPTPAPSPAAPAGPGSSPRAVTAGPAGRAPRLRPRTRRAAALSPPPAATLGLAQLTPSPPGRPRPEPEAELPPARPARPVPGLCLLLCRRPTAPSAPPGRPHPVPAPRPRSAPGDALPPRLAHSSAPGAGRGRPSARPDTEGSAAPHPRPGTGSW